MRSGVGVGRTRADDQDTRRYGESASRVRADGLPALLRTQLSCGGNHEHGTTRNGEQRHQPQNSPHVE